MPRRSDKTVGVHVKETKSGNAVQGTTKDLDNLERKTTSSTKGTKKLSFAALEAARAFEDFQFAGIRGIVNNLSQLGVLLGGPLIGALGTGLVVAISQMSGALGTGERTTARFRQELAELEKQATQTIKGIQDKQELLLFTLKEELSVRRRISRVELEERNADAAIKLLEIDQSQRSEAEKIVERGKVQLALIKDQRTEKVKESQAVVEEETRRKLALLETAESLEKERKSRVQILDNLQKEKDAIAALQKEKETLAREEGRLLAASFEGLTEPESRRFKEVTARGAEVQRQLDQARPEVEIQRETTKNIELLEKETAEAAKAFQEVTKAEFTLKQLRLEQVKLLRLANKQLQLATLQQQAAEKKAVDVANKTLLRQVGDSLKDLFIDPQKDREKEAAALVKQERLVASILNKLAGQAGPFNPFVPQAQEFKNVAIDSKITTEELKKVFGIINKMSADTRQFSVNTVTTLKWVIAEMTKLRSQIKNSVHK